MSSAGANLTPLLAVLWAKVLLTVLAWCLPLLFFPASLLAALGFPVPEPEVFLRLLGVAYVALVVGYGFGIRAAQQGLYPKAPVWVGIVSNGGAFCILVFYAMKQAFGDWGAFAQVFMWGSLLGTGAITAGLIAFGPWGRRLPVEESDLDMSGRAS